MKKVIIFLVIVLMIVASVSYMYLNYQSAYREASKVNTQYESYKDKEINGAELATLINRVVDNNKKNNIEKDDTGLYMDNGQTSIKLDILFSDDDKVHTLEEIYSGGINIFMQYYNQINFKCSKMEYHKSTGRVSYLYFEQTTS